MPAICLSMSPVRGIARSVETSARAKMVRFQSDLPFTQQLARMPGVRPIADISDLDKRFTGIGGTSQNAEVE